MLSPLVNTVVPVHNLDGSIDESSPGIEHFYWVDGPSDRPYWGDDPGSVHLRPRVHIAPGGFTTVRFPAQGPHPQDDVEGSDQESYDDLPLHVRVGLSVVYYSNRCSLLLTAFCCILVHFNAFNKISLHSILMHF